MPNGNISEFMPEFVNFGPLVVSFTSYKPLHSFSDNYDNDAMTCLGPPAHNIVTPSDMQKVGNLGA